MLKGICFWSSRRDRSVFSSTTSTWPGKNTNMSHLTATLRCYQTWHAGKSPSQFGDFPIKTQNWNTLKHIKTPTIYTGFSIPDLWLHYPYFRPIAPCQNASMTRPRGQGGFGRGPVLSRGCHRRPSLFGAEMIQARMCRFTEGCSKYKYLNINIYIYTILYVHGWIQRPSQTAVVVGAFASLSVPR